MSIDQPKQDQDVSEAETVAAEQPEASTSAEQSGVDTGAEKKASGGRPRKKAFGWVRLIGVVVLLVALGALALAGHNYQQMQAQHELLGRLQTLEQGLALQGQARGELQEQLEARVLEERAIWQKGEQRLQQALAQTSARITQMDGNRREDWLLAEAEYLLRLASQRLLVEGDIKSAKVLIASADQVVQSIDDYSLLKVREALQQDLVALRAVPEQDVNGAYLQLAALADQITLLPSMPVEPFQRTEVLVSTEKLAGAAEQQGAAQDSSLSDELIENAQGLALQAWQGFAGLYRINSNRDEPVQVLLTPEEEIYLRQNLRLMLEQAQLALLQGRQPVYDHTLEKAQQWLERYFQRQPATLAMADQLKELAKLQVQAQQPEIGRGLKALKAHLEALYQQSLQPRSQPQAAEERAQ